MSLTPEQIKEAWTAESEAGAWRPPKGDALDQCEFGPAGFRSWGMEATDKSWRLVLSKLDFGSSEPTALLKVYAPGHPAAFGDLGGFVLNQSIGTLGGRNFGTAVSRLNKILGGSDNEWDRRLTYLIAKAEQANAGTNNGTFRITNQRPEIKKPTDFVFAKRVRQGRTISLFAPGSAGKTTITDGLIVSACSGLEIIPGWIPSRRFSTLILDWDEGEDEEMVRLAAICAFYDTDLADYHYKRQTRPLHDVVDEIGAYVVEHSIELVIVSPMGRAQRSFGENITAPVDEIHEILRSFGTTNVLIDHVTGENIKGGAQREFGSVRKRDNVRGSYAIDVQFEEPGNRVLVIRNTKSDPLSPKRVDQGVSIQYDPPWPKEDGSYDTISFHPAEVIEADTFGTDSESVPNGPMRDRIYAALLLGHASEEALALRLDIKKETVRKTLIRWQGKLFNRLPSKRWEALPESPVEASTNGV